MKNISTHIKQVTLFLLLGIFMLGSMGFNVCSHTCRYSGATDYSLVLQHKSEACCDTKAPVKKSCCDDKDTYVKLDVVKKMEEDKTLSSHQLLKLVAILLPDYAITSLQIPAAVFASHAPPILSARTLLSLVQVSRI